MQHDVHPYLLLNCCGVSIIRVLREVRASLETEVSHLKESLGTKENEVSSLLREVHELRADKEAELSRVRAELKMKSFEVTALGVSYEVCTSTVTTMIAYHYYDY